jgi:pyrimidine-nucleoside phosphorylase
MTFEETTVLTDIMVHSGSVIDLSSVPGIKVDKHSTGGVGDKVSLILAPMVASCGVPVPMISGRGLGHTGGTLDKLESIPGFRTDLPLQEYVAILREVGVVMIGQTREIAPADKKLYALRDVTGTVESIPLIAGSIMSKKIAEGTDALVLDVKTGRGAFMRSREEAVRLTETLIAVGKKFGKKTVGFLTDMNQPLGRAVGNWLEVAECIDCMRGGNVPDLMELTYVLGGAMVMLGGKAATLKEGIGLCRRAIASGDALATFRKMVGRQGGDVAVIDNPGSYRRSSFTAELRSDATGDVEMIDALEIGFSAIMLGAGRMKVEDTVNPAAGIVLKKKVGDSVNAGDVLATLHADGRDALAQALHRVQRAINIATEPAAGPPLIQAMIDEKGVHPWRGLEAEI